MKSGLLIFLVIILVLSLITLIRRAHGRSKNRKLALLAQQRCREVGNSPTIFVSIPSYRDPECLDTLQELFAQAYCPLRIFVGICEQNYPLDGHVERQYRNLPNEVKYLDNVRICQMHPSEAEGPILARHVIERDLYRGETFLLMIDSHMQFSRYWDRDLLQMWKDCHDSHSILTTYPGDFVDSSRSHQSDKGTFLRFRRFDKKTKLPELTSQAFRKLPSCSYPSLFQAACFAFSPASRIWEVPHDPYCHYVFPHEEFLMSARLWTHGYNFMSCPSVPVRHRWERKRPTFWEQFSDSGNQVHQQRRRLEDKGNRRSRRLLRMESGWELEQEAEKYGLGNIRSFDDYLDFCGLSLVHQSWETHSKLGTRKNAPSHEILAKYGSFEEFYEEEKKAKIVKQTE